VAGVESGLADAAELDIGVGVREGEGDAVATAVGGSAAGPDG
jgi:hypothetical protein